MVHTEKVLDCADSRSNNVEVSIAILNPEERDAMRRAGQVAAETLAFVVSQIKAGISTQDINQWVEEDTKNRGARPSQLGYHGFPACVCTSRNSVVCHGVPNASEVLFSGDIINVDITSEIGGFHGDTSVTVCIGNPPAAARRVWDVARRCLEVGIATVRPGARLGDVGAAIERLARAEGCNIVREYGGHGIGRKMHQAPHISHVGPAGRGLRLQEGMAFTIEPMVTIGRPKLDILADGWTVVTRDGSPSAQFEHTLVVTKDGCEITTQQSIAMNLICSDG